MSRDLRSRLSGLTVVLTALIAGCAGSAPAPITSKDLGPPQRPIVSSRADHAAVTSPDTPSERPAVYQVKAGDTLYSIAWRFGLDYRSIAAWNGLADPDVIYSGQRLRLSPRTPAAPSAAPQPPPGQAKKIETAARATPQHNAIPRPEAAPSSVRWVWPASGSVTTASSPLVGNRGLEIRGKRGDSVRAAANGQVVYSGSGLRGYGELIIIKHDDVFLSAYAHNDQRLVAEGSDVIAGQEIAKMGDSEADDVMLHFEIRRHGKPVEPLQYLPRR